MTVVSTCSLAVNNPSADDHLLAISASEYLLNFSPGVKYLPETLHLPHTVSVMRHFAPTCRHFTSLSVSELPAGSSLDHCLWMKLSCVWAQVWMHACVFGTLTVRFTVDKPLRKLATEVDCETINLCDDRSSIKPTRSSNCSSRCQLLELQRFECVGEEWLFGEV